MELDGLDAGAVSDLDHTAGKLVAEHADGEDLGWQPAGDVVHLLRRDLPRRGSEDEADGIGTHRHREQRVVLVGDAADLHEHGEQNSTDSERPRRQRTIAAIRFGTDARICTIADRRVGGGDERLAHQDRVVAGVAQHARVVWTAHARLGDLHHTVGDHPRHAHGAVVVDLERDTGRAG